MPSVHAVGLSGPFKPTYLFEPDMEINLTYLAINSQDQALNVSLGLETDTSYCCGDTDAETKELIKLAKITPQSILLGPGEQQEFNVYIKFPHNLTSPGQHGFLLRATEGLPNGGGLAARASVRTPFFVFVRFPGKHIDVRFDTPDVEAGKTQIFHVTGTNRGTLNISNIYATINIFDSQNKSVGTVETNTDRLPRDLSTILEADWNTTDLPEGTYFAVADVTYDGLSKQANGTFRIGSLNIIITNYTRTIQANTINPFEVKVESRWNEVIRNVYAVVNIKKDGQLLATFQTPTTQVQPWTKSTVNGFFDADQLPTGEYDADVILYYEGGSTATTGKITIVKKGLLIGYVLSPFGIFALLIIINLLLWFFMIRKRKNPETPPVQQTGTEGQQK